jgi:hypothetical protein
MDARTVTQGSEHQRTVGKFEQEPKNSSCAASTKCLKNYLRGKRTFPGLQKYMFYENLGGFVFSTGKQIIISSNSSEKQQLNQNKNLYKYYLFY